MDAGLIAPAVIVAALVVRTAVAELRSPGSAGRAFAAIWATAALTRLAVLPHAGGEPERS
ncbi:hypothetical protein [Streptomyces sp. NPDC048392]|uniref:hypothetical protein n=1 Tax=Streptomyces sp. NPDC048392 TaxID=3365543 RepID=UPI003712A95F